MQPQPNYFKANFANIRKKLGNINWEDILLGKFEESYGLNAFIKVKGIIYIYIYLYIYIYVNGDALRLKNKKQKLWKKYASSRSSNIYAKFEKCKNHLRSLRQNWKRLQRRVR